MIQSFMRRSRLFRFSLITAVLGSASALVSCGTVKFYTQAMKGQAQIWSKSKPIPEVLADSATTAKLRQRLELVQGMRRFAQEKLLLPADEAYSQYADLGRDYVVWVVYAAPEFSVEAKGWWYPIVGNLKYKGFFSKESAVAFAADVKKQQLDVVVGGVEAYSTLGWFHDPVMNTFIHRDEAELAELLFHELTHIRLFLPGDTDFNEALATCVGQEGARRWLKAQGNPAELRRYNDALAKDAQIISLLQGKRKELAALYEKNQKLPSATQREAKAALMKTLEADYQTLRQHWNGDSRYDPFFKVPMNNARLSSLATYYDLVPAFDALLKRCHGDLEQFFAKVSALRDLEPKQRMKALLPVSPLP